MSNPVLEILIIFLLLVTNGVFAMAEIAIVSARKARLRQLADAGNSQARAALELAANPNQFLATAQIGITLVGILAGAFGGATIAEEIATRLGDIPFLAPYGETIGVGIVVLGITYFSLIIGELVPKRLALNNAERIASAVAAPMRGLSTIAAPVVRLLSVSTDIVIRLLGIKPSAEPSITPEELRILIEQGTESGVFEESEQDMIESVLRLDERRVGAFMTPRTHIVWFDIEDSPEDIRRKIADSQHSRFPVIKDSLDNVLGIVRAKDLLNQSLAGQPLDLRALLRPPLFIPESMSALKVLELFKQKGTHVALVTDEYGGIQGMVTHNDILEGIVGYIPSAGEPAEPQATRREDGSWLLDGLVHIDKLKEIFDIEKLPDEEHGHYQTVGGFVMTQVRSIPTVGQCFEWGKLRFEVVDMDGRRVDKVLVTPSQAQERQNA
ncbi:MAG TPA: hemolysin family protein [Anaerolineales bacterium]|nr:hemolysin family protein [Anaerolineales bacterium]